MTYFHWASVSVKYQGGKSHSRPFGMAANGWEWMRMAENGWEWMGMVGNGCEWPGMDGNGGNARMRFSSLEWYSIVTVAFLPSTSLSTDD